MISTSISLYYILHLERACLTWHWSPSERKEKELLCVLYTNGYLLRGAFHISCICSCMCVDSGLNCVINDRTHLTSTYAIWFLISNSEGCPLQSNQFRHYSSFIFDARTVVLGVGWEHRLGKVKISICGARCTLQWCLHHRYKYHHEELCFH